MRVEFQASPQSSVGIEWEICLVDAETLELAPRVDEIFQVLGIEHNDGPIRREYLLCMIELVSRAHACVADAVADLAANLKLVQDAAASLGMRVMASGTHPTTRSASIPIYQAPRPIRVLEQNGYWGRNLAISGTHVHVGVANVDHVLAITGGLARFYPYLLALSASSPYWEGDDTAFASHRTMLFQQLSTNGLPPLFEKWSDYEDYALELADVGMIREAQEIRWDVRPAPRFGTIENRAMDAVPTLAEVGCLAALTQCFVEFAVRNMDDIDVLQPWIVRENKWRAARYGVDAEIIVPRYYEQRVRPLRQGFYEWLGRLETVAEPLGCTPEIAFARRLISAGPSYTRQRQVAADSGGDLSAVAASLCEEMDQGIPNFA